MIMRSGLRDNTSPQIPQSGKLLIEVATDAAGALPQGKDLGHDLVALPLAAPQLPGGTHCHLGVEGQLTDVDPLVAGQCGVS